MLVRGAPEAEIQLKSRPSRKSPNMDDLIGFGRLLMRGAQEVEIQPMSRPSHKWSKMN